MDSTIASIVGAADMPFSVLIVGVGSADFTQMDTLDGDKQRLSSGGRVASRDIVQFVPMREFMSGGSGGPVVVGDISKALLAEIPGQLLEFFGQHKIQPNPRPTPAFAAPSTYLPPPAATAPPVTGGYV